MWESPDNLQQRHDLRLATISCQVTLQVGTEQDRQSTNRAHVQACSMSSRRPSSA